MQGTWRRAEGKTVFYCRDGGGLVKPEMAGQAVSVGDMEEKQGFICSYLDLVIQFQTCHGIWLTLLVLMNEKCWYKFVLEEPFKPCLRK